MVAPERFNSSQVPRNIDNLCDYIDNLSDENYERYEDWRIENRDNFVREYSDLLDEHHVMQYMNSSGLESETESDLDLESDSEEEDSDDEDSDEDDEFVDSEEDMDVIQDEDMTVQTVIEEPQPQDDCNNLESEFEYTVISDEESDYDSDEDIDADYAEWLYPYLSTSHVSF
tara:strand:+ start:42 stop:557 length:516 start_codon:yes stop_codon:yes gene_type:complete